MMSWFAGAEQAPRSAADLEFAWLDPEVMFTDRKGRTRSRVERRQRKLLAKISPFVDAFLQKDEHIWLVTTGCSPFGLLEQLFTGWTILYLKRSLLIFTDRRILHVPTRLNYGYRHSIAQIAYADCESVQVRGSRLIVKYKDGKKEKFCYIARSERQKIRSLIERMRLDATPAQSPGRVHLCPSCTRTLQAESYQCGHCHLAFKDAVEAKRVSILYPGGGYFYTGHPWLGIGDAITEACLIFMVGALLWEWNKGTEAAAGSALFFGMVLVVEKAVTILHALGFVREFIPKEKPSLAGLSALGAS